MADMRAMVEQNPILAIFRNVPNEHAVAYARAVMNGGVRFFEVALNSPGAFDQIRLLRAAFGPDILLGAGTAVTPDLAQMAMDAGAGFLLTPSAPEPVLAYCQQHDISLLPGVMTPTDVQRCLDHGFSTLKLFPAGDLPMSYVKSLQGPYDQTRYMAIGGVSAANAADFLRAGYLAVGLASALVPKAALAACDWDACTRAVQELVRSVAACRPSADQT